MEHKDSPFGKITVSIGIKSCKVLKNHESHTFIKEADKALYKAEKSNRNKYRFVFYSSDMSEINKIKIEIETNLHSALKNGEMTLFYQAKYDPYKNRITGAEALIRWFSKKNGTISPAEFIPIAETSGLILEIDEWVLLTACR